MSVCEPLGECKVGEVDECPALHSTFTEHGHKFYCAMRGGRKGFPATCPHAAALRAVVENPGKVELLAVDSKIAKACRETLYKVHVPDAGESEVVLVAVPKDAESVTVHRAKDHGDHVVRWDSTINLEVEPDLSQQFSPRTCCEGCIRFPCKSYLKDGSLRTGLGVVPDSRDRPGCYRPVCCEGCAREKCLCGGNRIEQEGERPYCYEATLDLESEEKVCGTCKFNSDKLIRICYGCVKYSKWEPEENTKGSAE